MIIVVYLAGPATTGNPACRANRCKVGYNTRAQRATNLTAVADLLRIYRVEGQSGQFACYTFNFLHVYEIYIPIRYT